MVYTVYSITELSRGLGGLSVGWIEAGAAHGYRVEVFGVVAAAGFVAVFVFRA